MAKIRTIQIYRGTKAQNDAYTGSVGELTMDTDNNDVRIHDGSTLGGHPIGFHPYLFYHEWADYEVSDTNWLRADTFSWQDGTVYEAAYDHLEADIIGKSLSSETVGGVTVQFYLADDGHKICPASEESNVVSIFTATGVAWYYIIDTVNERFKLPRTQYGFDGFRDTVGKYVEAGLPNVTGDVTGSNGNGNSIFKAASGAFTLGGSHTSYGIGTGSGLSGGSNTAVTFDASRSSSVYGNNSTVQPPATQQYLYFYVGNFTQTALENTAGLNASLFNGKADVDLGNLSSAGQKVLDGQWVVSGLSIISGATVTTTHTQYSLASYLPNDGYDYEILVGLGTANSAVVNIASDLGTGFGVRGAASGSAQLYNQGVIVVGTGRYVEIWTTSSTSSNSNAGIAAYRRVGTNS